MDIKEFAKEAHQTALEKGWYDKGEPSIEGRLLLIHAEISEAAEEVRKNDDLSHIYFIEKNGQQKPEGFLVELADALIRMGDMLGRKGLVDEFLRAVELKMEYNKTREYRHGNKLF